MWQTMRRVHVSRLFLVLAALFLLAPPTEAAHVAAHQCGVSSGKFARICRPGAYSTCLRAVQRGVAGLTKKKCDDRMAACSTCLKNIHTCISRIGHWPKLTHTCDTCKARFDRCIKKRYPAIP